MNRGLSGRGCTGCYPRREETVFHTASSHINFRGSLAALIRCLGLGPDAPGLRSVSARRFVSAECERGLTQRASSCDWEA